MGSTARFTALWSVAFAAFALASCAESTSPPRSELGSIEFAPRDTVVVAGRAAVQLALTVRDTEGRVIAPAQYAVSFSADPAQSATVTPSGLVQDIRVGTVNITATMRVGSTTRTATAIIRGGVVICCLTAVR